MNKRRAFFGRDLPDSWELATIGDVAKVVGGSTPKSKEPSYWGGPIPWLAVSDLTGYRDQYISGGARSITQAGYDSCATQILPAGAVIFSSRAPIGYVAIAARDLCTSQGFKSFVPTDAVSSEYLYWYLQAARPLIEQLASGTTFKEISGRAAKTIPVPIPPRTEQDRIVAAIQTAMAGVNAAVSAIGEAEQMLDVHRAAVLEAECLGRTGGERHARPANGPLGIPQGWEWRPVAELAADEDRAITDGPFGSNLKTAHYTDSGPRVIRLQNVGEGEFLDFEAHISHERFERLRAHEARAGDVVVASLGETLPRACVVPEDLGPAIVKADCPRIRVGEMMRPEFLCAALNSPLVRRQAAGLIAGIGRPRLNLAKLKQLRIPTPPLVEQDRILQRIHAHAAARERVAEALAGSRIAAGTLHRSILNRAFTGHLIPQVPEDESASELLRRIRDDRGAADPQLKAAAS